MSNKFSKTKVINYSTKNLLVRLLLKKVDLQIAKGEPSIDSLIISKTLDLAAFKLIANHVLENQKN